MESGATRARLPGEVGSFRFGKALASTEAQWTIRDEGPGFDVRALPDPTDPEYLERPHGRGLFLMRTFMSEVAYNDRGNEVRMVKRKSTEPHATR